MTDVQRFLVELAELGDGAPVVTLYLDTAWRDEHQRERVRVFFRERAKEAERLFVDGEQAEGIRRSLGQLEAYVDRLVNQEVHTEANGLCVVASAERGIFRECTTSEPLPMAMYIDTRPRLAPLVEAISPVAHAFLVIVDSQGAQILEWTAGEIVDESKLSRLSEREQKLEGWSAHRFQSSVREHTRVIWQEAVQLLGKLVAPESNPVIVLFGQGPSLRSFERELPRDLFALVADMLPAAPSRQELLAKAREVLQEERVTREFKLLNRILGEAQAGKFARLGVPDVLEASNERTIHTLVVTRSFDALGFLCSNCHALWHTGSSGCAFCGAVTKVVPLREELVRRCLREGARVSVVADGTGLDAFRGVGAMLRHNPGDQRPIARPAEVVAAPT